MKKNERSHGLPKKNHWEVHYNMHKPSENMVVTEGADFEPKCPEYRKTTHLKVNIEDH